ncbi:outer membrane beta-barrel family protein [Allomuricauda sp. F6463D]|uniref:outer membrane beta-barrel family protein n=1 Tax=Allomuricauda sp. F6463D TaxID=2926409 RepID=UPI001FF4DCBA|nr:outer membrane beta-barrel family protein [Muricauda sp. F6463D]MCK0161782.1 TonB-dependent receptor family protein [Muricauda sp. F6463D]
MKQLHWLFIALSVSSYGQEQFTVKGKVIDAYSEMVQIGDVFLFDSNRENLVMYTTLHDGQFILEEISAGDYSLEVSALGFKKYSRTISVDKNLEFSVHLIEQVTELEDVEVIALKNPITNNNGNLKIDVQNPVFLSIADPLDVLSKLPNIQISPDRESISVISRGSPLIYLGNQRISLEELKGLSVEFIESIELINNPSPKYEAEGQVVILVHLKMSRDKGASFSLGETLSFRQNTNHYLSSNGSFSNGKWNLRGNLNYNAIGQWESNTFEFAIPEEDIYSNYLVLIPDNNRIQINGGLGLYYPINDSDYVSFNTTMKLQTDEADFETNTFVSDGIEENQILSKPNNDNQRRYFSGNFNLNKKLDADWNLFTGIQYSTFKQTLDTDIFNNYNNESFFLDESRYQEYEIGSLAACLDVEHTISDKLRSEFGASWNEAQATAHSKVQQLETQNEENVDYDYKERLYASYLNFSSNLNKKLDVSIGARVEYNDVSGTLNNETNPLVSRKNTRFFPKAGLNLKIDSVKTLSFNYSKSITRPNFSRTSSVSVFINPFLEATNNINLVPTISRRISSNLQWKNKSFFLDVYQKENPSYYAISYEANDTTATLSPINLEKEMGFYVGATFPFSYKIWTSTTSVSLNYNKITDSSAVVATVKPYVYAYTDHQFKVAKDTIVSFGGWMMTERNEGIYTRNTMLILNASVTKTLFDKFQCAIRLNDISKAMNFEESYSINGVEANGTYFVDAREIAFAIKYKFDNNTNKFKNKDVDENLNRIN